MNQPHHILTFKSNKMVLVVSLTNKQKYYWPMAIGQSDCKIYSEDISIFGPLSVDQLPDGFNEMSKEEQDEAKELVKISKEL